MRLLAERGELGGDGATLPAVVPERVREVVGRRLEPLEPATREVLAIAGVVGRPFTIAGSRASAGSAARASRRRSSRRSPAGWSRRGQTRPAASASRTRSCATRSTTSCRPRCARACTRRSPPCCRSRSRPAARRPRPRRRTTRSRRARCGADPQAAWALSREAAREAAGLQAHAEAAAHYARRAGGARAGRRGRRRPSGSRRRSRSPPPRSPRATSRPRAALPHGRAAARRSGAAELHARAAIGFSEVQHYGSIDDDAIALLQDALDALPPDDSALRARASARLGQRLDPVTDQARREALLDEGVAMARRLGDADALVSLLSAAALVNWPPERAAARRAAAEEVLGLAVRGADLAAVFWARTIKLRDALEAGELDAVDAELDRLARMAAESRRTYYRWCLLVLQAARAIFAGRLAEGERLAEDAVALNRRHGDDADQEHTVQRLALALLRRRPQDAPIAALRDYAARYPALPVWEAMLAQAEWGLRADGARRSVEACARDGFSGAPAHAGLAVRARPAGRAGRRRGDGRAGRAARRGARSARRPQRRDGRRLGRLRPGRAPARPARGRRRAARGGRGALRAGRRARGALGRARLGAGGDRRLAARGAGVPDSLRDRGIALARDLELPWIASELATQTTTP